VSPGTTSSQTSHRTASKGVTARVASRLWRSVCQPNHTVRTRSGTNSQSFRPPSATLTPEPKREHKPRWPSPVHCPALRSRDCGRGRAEAPHRSARAPSSRPESSVAQAPACSAAGHSCAASRRTRSRHCPGWSTQVSELRARCFPVRRTAGVSRHSAARQYLTTARGRRLGKLEAAA
jgi:hypothetical protein